MAQEDKDIVLDDICKRLSLRPPQVESLRRLAVDILNVYYYNRH